MTTSNEEYIRKNKVVIVDDDKNTRLHYACALNNFEVVEKEAATGQKLDPENYLGWTPLMMAVRNGHFAIVDFLLIKGADATKKNKFNISVFLMSVTCGDLDLLEKILYHLLCGGVSRQSLQKTFSPISMAIMFGQPQIIKYLIERSFDVNMPTPVTGITPLMFAAAIGNNKAIKKLLQNNADISAKNCLGKTAPEILQFRHQKIDIDNPSEKRKPVPLIIVSPHNPNSPCLQLTPYQVTATQNVRKSSNVGTPHMFATPNITPITSVNPQVFFGTNFSPGQFMTPMGYPPNEVLNTALTPSRFFSPYGQQYYQTNYV